MICATTQSMKLIHAQSVAIQLAMINNGKHRYYVYSYLCDWRWENPPITHKDNYLEKNN